MDIERRTGAFTSDDEEIYWELSGSSGEVVVLGHGYGGNHAIWYQQVPVVASSFRALTWDQRGFGRSSNRRGLASPAAAAGDLERLLDHLEIEQAHLVGQSMGGWAVVGFALAHPERVLSITLADTSGGLYTEALRQHFTSHVSRRPAPGELPLHRHPALGDQLGDRDPVQAFLYTQIGSVAPPVPAGMPAQLRSTAHDMAALAGSSLPVLFIVGSDDPIFPVALMRGVAEQLPGSRLVEIPETGHSPYFERPEAWNGALLDFLRAVGGHDTAGPPDASQSGRGASRG